MKKIYIHTDFIKLDQLLKYTGIVGSGSEAKILINSGYVSVNKFTSTLRGKKIYNDDEIEVKYEDYHFRFIICSDKNRG